MVLKSGRFTMCKYHVSSGARSGSGTYMVSGSREPDYSPLANQFVTLCRLVCGSAGVARRHASRTSSLVTALMTRSCRFCGTSTK